VIITVTGDEFGTEKDTVNVDNKNYENDAVKISGKLCNNSTFNSFFENHDDDFELKRRKG